MAIIKLDNIKAVFINLDERKDRRKYMEAMLSKLPLEYERFSGVRPRLDQLLQEDGQYRHLYNKCVPRIKQYLLDERRLPRGLGVIGCYISHFEVISMASWSPKHLLLLEDDCCFGLDSLERLCEAANSISDWHMLRSTYEAEEERLLQPAAFVSPNFQSKHATKYKNPNQIHGGSHFSLIRADKIREIVTYLEDEYLYNIDSIYSTNVMRVYVGSFGVGVAGFSTNIPKL